MGKGRQRSGNIQLGRTVVLSDSDTVSKIKEETKIEIDETKASAKADVKEAKDEMKEAKKALKPFEKQVKALEKKRDELIEELAEKDKLLEERDAKIAELEAKPITDKDVVAPSGSEETKVEPKAEPVADEKPAEETPK